MGCTLAFSGFECCSVDMYSRIQWDTAEVNERNNEVHLLYSGCQTISVNFLKYQSILNSLVLKSPDLDILNDYPFLPSKLNHEIVNVHDLKMINS